MAPADCSRVRSSERNDVLGRGGGASESVPLCLPTACFLAVRFVLTQPQMDKAPFVPVIDSFVFSDLQKLRGRKDLVVKRTSGHYEGGWELPLHAQVFQALSDDQLHVIVTKKQSIFSSSADEKEVDVRELIQLNIPQDVSTPTTPKSPVYGIKKETKPVPGVRSVWLMSMPEIKAEL